MEYSLNNIVTTTKSSSDDSEDSDSSSDDSEIDAQIENAKLRKTLLNQKMQIESLSQEIIDLQSLERQNKVLEFD